MLIFSSAYPCFCFVLIYTDEPGHGGFIVDVSEIERDTTKRPEPRQSDNTVSVFSTPTGLVRKRYTQKITNKKATEIRNIGYKLCLQPTPINMKSHHEDSSRRTRISHLHKLLGKFVRSIALYTWKLSVYST